MTPSEFYDNECVMARWLGCVIVTLILMCVAGCDDREAKLASAIREVRGSDSASVDELIMLCRESGAEADVVLRGSLSECSEADRCIGLIRAVVRDGVNENLLFLLEVCADDESRSSALPIALRGRLDAESREMLQHDLKASTGPKTVLLLRILELVCDDERSLVIAKDKVATSSSREELIASLCLLGSAAYYNNDEVAVDSIREHLVSDDDGIGLIALTALFYIPGQEADELLRSPVLSQKVDRKAFESLLAERDRMMNVGVRVPSGWKTNPEE